MDQMQTKLKINKLNILKPMNQIKISHSYHSQNNSIGQTTCLGSKF